MFKRFIQWVFLIFSIILVFSVFWQGLQWFSENLENFFQLNKAAILPEPSFEDLPPPKTDFPQKNPEAPILNINALSAISVYTDIENPDKVLFEKNIDQKMAIASLTKLMTAAIVLENFDLSQDVKISKIAAQQDARNLLKAGKIFLAKDLLYEMLINSDNSAAYAFAETIGQDDFIKAMNLKANELGMEDTYFSGPMGLANKNYSTVQDFALLAKYLIKENSQIMKITQMPEFDLHDAEGNFYYKAINLNGLLKDAELKERIVLGKTGETKEAGQCLLVVLRAPAGEGYLINVVLGAEDRLLETKNIIDWDDKAFLWK